MSLGVCMRGQGSKSFILCSVFWWISIGWEVLDVYTSMFFYYGQMLNINL